MKGIVIISDEVTNLKNKKYSISSLLEGKFIRSKEKYDSLEITASSIDTVVTKVYKQSNLLKSLLKKSSNAKVFLMLGMQDSYEKEIDIDSWIQSYTVITKYLELLGFEVIVCLPYCLKSNFKQYDLFKKNKRKIEKKLLNLCEEYNYDYLRLNLGTMKSEYYVSLTSIKTILQQLYSNIQTINKCDML